MEKEPKENQKKSDLPKLNLYQEIITGVILIFAFLYMVFAFACIYEKEYLCPNSIRHGKGGGFTVWEKCPEVGEELVWGGLMTRRGRMDFVGWFEYVPGMLHRFVMYILS